MADKDEPIVWDSVDWTDTHIECAEGMYHMGVYTSARGERLFAFATEDRADTPDCQIILLNEGDIDNLFLALRRVAI